MGVGGFPSSWHLAEVDDLQLAWSLDAIPPTIEDAEDVVPGRNGLEMPAPG